MLVKYREELSRPLEEAMDFMRRIESQLNVLQTGIFNSAGTFFSISIYHTYIKREREMFHGLCLSWKEQASTGIVTAGIF